MKPLLLLLAVLVLVVASRRQHQEPNSRYVEDDNGEVTFA